MKIGYMIVHPEITAERLRRFVSLDDAEFAGAFLDTLSPEEIASFHQLCPEFPVRELPQKTP
ncbi:hypothetical protein [Marvinbryantia formatexigens]|uniref:hypothetical protein n=1 Tax=Marvinbryantia formatexigens TaxID=168384 RepID=UPI00030A6FEC|nr:hypothetical protein [Marvinbryantia formatexigens]UWO25595.1 hypothetical protein NQ534_03685 [Marvinbryantia formatexigens DSM 14469]SDG18256.1 hypothetical protein SAMN05660368_02071 [Marvinbryantia formatexigens]